MRELYTVATNVNIPSLNIVGPITSPTYLPEGEVLMLVRKYGAVIYKHNPDYPKEKYLVTNDNLGRVTFKKTRRDAALERIQGFDRKAKEVKVDVTKKKNRFKNRFFDGKKNENNKDDKTTDTPVSNGPKIVPIENTAEESSTDVVRPDDFVNTQSV